MLKGRDDFLHILLPEQNTYMKRESEREGETERTETDTLREARGADILGICFSGFTPTEKTH